MSTITDNTPVAMLTVGQLREVLRIPSETQPPEEYNEDAPRQYVYGLKGIRQLFGVSHVTAFKYKETIIRGAVSQQGRVIVTDIDKAMELFRAYNKRGGGK